MRAVIDRSGCDHPYAIPDLECHAVDVQQ